jgi:hypothetical protein
VKARRTSRMPRGVDVSLRNADVDRLLRFKPPIGFRGKTPEATAARLSVTSEMPRGILAHVARVTTRWTDTSRDIFDDTNQEATI